MVKKLQQRCGAYNHDASLILLRGFGRGSSFVLRAVVLPFDDACRLAASAAEVIKLGAAHLTAAHHLDRVDHRRIEREHALDAFAVRNLPDGEVLVEA